MATRKPLVLVNGGLQQLAAADTIASVGIRQTVTAGSVDANGFPNALSAGSGLSVNLAAATTPFEIAFAAGYSKGNVDYPETLSSNQTFSSLNANTTNYLYVDRNVSTGALSLGFSNLIPTYSPTAPSSPATNQHWFDRSTFLMKYWSGSGWTTVQRVFVGEATTGASSVTAVSTYAYLGFYDTGWFAVSASNTYVKNHYLGMSLSDAGANVAVYSSSSATGVSTLTTIAAPYVTVWNMVTNQTFGYLPKSSAADLRTALGILLGANGVHYDNGSGSWLTSGYFRITFKRGW